MNRITSCLSGLLIVLVVWGCAPDDRQAQEVVDRAIAAHGFEQLDRVEVTFTFRDDAYRMLRYDGQFRYERSYADTVDILTNDGPRRLVNDQPVELTEDDAESLATTVNSVVYFGFLPYRLNDDAVQKRHLGRVQIFDEPYHKVEVTFDEEGGGRDHDDRFVYWFHTENHTLDYLAYYFHTDDGGTRYREAINRREVDGLTVQDYYNYTLEPDTLGLHEIERYDQFIGSGALELVSVVRLVDVAVRPLDAKPEDLP